MKCLSISTCFVLSCYTGLWAIAIVDVLSQYKLIVSFCLKSKSDSTFLIHKSSHTPSVMPLGVLFKDLKNNSDVLFQRIGYHHIYTYKSGIILHLLKEWVHRFAQRDNNA